MGLYGCTCQVCNKPFTWFSGGPQVCNDCQSPKPSSFKEERDAAAEEYFHKYHGPDEEYEGWESEDYKAGYTACLRSQLVNDMATAGQKIADCYDLKSSTNDESKYFLEALAAYEKEVGDL